MGHKEARVFIFCNLGSKGDSIEECPIFQKTFMMGQSKWPLPPKKKLKKKI
jgi:hypothetical protein